MRSFCVGLWLCWLIPLATQAQPPAEPSPGVQLGHLWQGQGEQARERHQFVRAAHCFARAAQAYRQAGETGLARTALQAAERLLPLTDQTITVGGRITLVAV